MSDAHDARLQGCRIIKDLRNLGARERGVTESHVFRILFYNAEALSKQVWMARKT